MSCKRLHGWAPRTFYSHDGTGRVVSSWTETEWDAYELALVEAYLDWKADMCPGCGRPRSESLRVEGRPDPQYVVGTLICTGCLELDAHRAHRATGDKQAHEQGRHPDLARLDTVYTRAEATQMAQQRR